MRRIRTGIFGGSFNPIHFGHIRLARHIRKEAALDEVWFMVSPQNPFKVNQTLLDDDKRLQLVKIALRREKGLKACDYEFRLPKPSYTWNTLQALPTRRSSDLQLGQLRTMVPFGRHSGSPQHRGLSA